MNTTRLTITVNSLWWVEFAHGVNHAVPAFQPPLNRALYHLLTWPDMVGLKVTKTHHAHGSVLVVDRYIGTLPVVAADEFMARAISEHWNRQVNGRQVDPGNVVQVMDWAAGYVAETARARLITDEAWPKNLPRTPFHDLRRED